jgi:hypothetical protein
VDFARRSTSRWRFLCPGSALSLLARGQLGIDAARRKPLGRQDSLREDKKYSE